MNFSFAFNQDGSCFSVSSASGYAVFRADPFGRLRVDSAGGISIIEMLFSSSLVALVGGGDMPAFSPRHMRMFNIRSNKTICELNFTSAVETVKMNNKRLVVVLQDRLHLFDLKSLSILQTLTSPNPNGICALSSSDSKSLLAFPCSLKCGDVLMYDALRLSAVRRINAHRAPVAVLGLSQDGSLLATASTKGTMIRVFQSDSGEKVATFRRGHSSAEICCLTFNKNSTLLAASSLSATVHVFKLPSAKLTPKEPQEQSFAGTLLAGGKSLMPSAFTEYVDTARSFAHVRLPETGMKTSCAICTSEEGEESLAVLSQCGKYRQYSIPEDGGGVLAVEGARRPRGCGGGVASRLARGGGGCEGRLARRSRD